VIIVNYNGGEWLTRCTAALAAQSESAFEAFIVDNGSTDGSIEALPELDARFEIILTGENLGFAAANNLAAKKARADYLVMLNPDAFARVDWLKNLLAEVKAPDITMVGSLQYMALEPDVLDGVGDFYHASGLAWRGGFGHAVYHGTRNRIWTFFKNTPLALLIILLPAHIGVNLFVLLWAGLRSGRFRPTLRGISDGLSGLPDMLRSRKSVQPTRVIPLSDVARMLSWSVQPVRNRSVPNYHPASPDE